jgi:N-methylhydantoinase B
MLDPETKCIDAAGEYFYFASTPVWKTRANAMFRYQTCGGGGWGDPLARDPQAVKRDVRDEYVTITGALRDYGVVIQGDPLNDPESLVVDEAATRKRREDMKRGIK